ncbi:hypothetical protein PCANC_24254 [Puccinia coronata f. sp. avenae]|uniref:Uncharacterized protein n=1 Tax=Puccinia coronata f. sp. avenae TaxID=200324 RepID=A0A2N5TJJ7_9BASI|nr:hypothetical protein PCANC_24254 [Puccinia coronata f. sp. avenae]PLW34043.1 hypothetical protein PCASD_14486 [Puccinia coronata f. sp. avenae]
MASPSGIPWNPASQLPRRPGLPDRSNLIQPGISPSADHGAVDSFQLQSGTGKVAIRTLRIRRYPIGYRVGSGHGRLASDPVSDRIMRLRGGV